MTFNPAVQNTGPILVLPTPFFEPSQYDIQPLAESPPNFTQVRKDVGNRAALLAKKHIKTARKLSNGGDEQPNASKRDIENQSQLANSQLGVVQGTPKRNRAVHPFPVMEPKEFYSDEPPYVLTTEIGQQAALESIRLRNPLKNGIYLGFAFEFNYHLLAERPFELAWICDINSRMHTLYQFIETTIVTTPTRDSFIEAFRKELEAKGDYYFSHEGGFAKKVIDHYLNEKFSWLHSEEKFLRIQDLYRNHRIHHVNLNIVDDSGYFAQMKMWAETNGYRFDTIYVSNIPEWLQRTDLVSVTKMKANLLKIMSPETHFIDAKQTSFEHGEPVVRITRDIFDAESFPEFAPPPRLKGRAHMRPLQVQQPQQRSGLASLFGSPSKGLFSRE